MEQYIIIEKHKKLKNIVIISSTVNHYNACSDDLTDILKLEISDFERNNGKVKKRKFKTDLKAIKQLIEDGYYVKVFANSDNYNINIIKPVEDKRQSVSFSTSKNNGVVLLLDKAEEWAQVMIEDYSTTNNI